MFRNFLGFAAMAVVLAACNPTETKLETPPKPTEVNSKVPDAPVALPAADPASVKAEWNGSALTTGTLVGVEVVDDTAVLVRTGEGEGSSGGKTTGAHVIFNLPETVDLSGLVLKVTTEVKSTSDEIMPFEVAYSTNVKGNSRWQSFEATGEFETYSFNYLIPSRFDNNLDAIGISVPEGSSVIVKSISLSVADPIAE
jgi:hypothetical protein